MSQFYRTNLDIVDKLLSELESETELKEARAVFEACPRLVVVGEQSAGKSSILSRLAGANIRLPTSQNRCTAVATVMKLRRGSPESKRIFVKGTAAETKAVQKEITYVEFCDGIAQAQQEAVRLEGDASFGGFVLNYVIEVLITSTAEDACNVTLIDLPGLFADNGEDKSHEHVLRLAETHVSYEGSVILFAVPLKGDFDNVHGKPIMKKHANSRQTIVVLTKIDTVEDHLAAHTKIEKITKDLGEATTFHVVVGELNNILASQSEEMEKLGPYKASLKDLRLSFGIQGLKSCMEASLEASMKIQIPKVLRLAKTSLKSTDDALHAMGKVPVSGIAYLNLAKQEIKDAFDDKERKLKRETRVRQLMEELKADVWNLEMMVAETGVWRADAEDLIIGSNVLVEVPSGEKSGTIDKRGVIVAVESSLYTVEIRDGEESKPTQHKVTLDNIYYRKSRSGVITRVKALLNERRGIQNVEHQGAQVVIDDFAGAWADEYGKAIHRVYEKVAEYAKNDLDEVLMASKHVQDSAQLRSVLQERVAVLMDELAARGEASIKRLVRYNQPPLTFTANNHYLEQTYRNLVAADKEPVSHDNDSFKTFYYRGKAYWKVQQKVIIEAACKDVAGIFLIDARDLLNGDFVFGSLADVEDDLAESEHKMKKRIALQRLKRKLEEAIPKLESVKWR